MLPGHNNSPNTPGVGVFPFASANNFQISVKQMKRNCKDAVYNLISVLHLPMAGGNSLEVPGLLRDVDVEATLLFGILE